MARIGSITFEMPGEGDQSFGQTLEEIFADLRRQLEQNLGKTIVTVGKIGKDAKNRISSVLKLFKDLASGTQSKSTGSSKRSLMGFDELNRLTKKYGSTAYIQRNTQLVKSVESLLGKIRQLGSTVNDKVVEPVLTWGKDKVMDTVTRIKEAISGVIHKEKVDLQDYSSIWDTLTQKTQTWAALLVTTDSATADFGKTLQQSGMDANQMAEYLRNLGFDASSTMGKLLGLGPAAQTGWEGVTDTWGNSDGWFSQKVTGPLALRFGSLWSKMKESADSGWSGTKTLFSDAGGFFETTFSDAWAKVGKVFAKEGQVNTQIQTGVLTGFKTAVNGLIDGINQVVTVPFGGLNDVLGKLQNIKVGNLKPFSFLTWRATAPKIPHLAQGAVLPANKPFLAMVGDQRHGTNIEAPLTTIQEALALVMEDHTHANMAGHAATVEVLREILQAVLGIHIGDDVIAAAYDRYQSKMSVVKGR